MWRWMPAFAGAWLLAAGAAAAAHRVEDVELPAEVDPQVGGLDFLPDGRAVVALHRGEVFIRQPEGGWRLYAEGLHEPLGVLAAGPAEVLVMQRAELTRLRDEDGDGHADHYQTVWDGFGMTGNYHEFAYGPVRAADGSLRVALNLGSTGDGVSREIRGPWARRGPSHEDFVERWTETKGRIWRMYSRVPWRGWVMRVNAEAGTAEPWSCGFRSPDGLDHDLQGRLFVTDNQGDFVGTSALFHSREGDFHGHPASLEWREGAGDPERLSLGELERMRAPPAVLFPHGLMANSPTGIACDATGGKFGPFGGQLFVGEMNTPRLLRVMLDEVDGQVQGACVPFLNGGGLRAGNHRLAFAPDGSLWVGQTHLAWAGGEGLQRIVWDGQMPLEVQRLELRPEGFLFTFTLPVDGASCPEPAQWRLRSYTYRYHGDYGSPQVGLREFAPEGLEWRDGGRQLWCRVPGLRAGGTVVEFNLPALRTAGGLELGQRLVCYTINRMPSAPPR